MAKMARSRAALSMTAVLAAGVVLFGQGCGAPSVGSFNGSGDFDINDADAKEPKSAKNKPGKKDEADPDEADEKGTTTQNPKTPAEPAPQTDPCLQCLTARSAAAAQYAECASKCPVSATDPTCDDNCWSTKGCAAQETVCANALNACDATCQ